MLMLASLPALHILPCRPLLPADQPNQPDQSDQPNQPSQADRPGEPGESAAIIGDPYVSPAWADVACAWLLGSQYMQHVRESAAVHLNSLCG